MLVKFNKKEAQQMFKILNEWEFYSENNYRVIIFDSYPHILYLNLRYDDPGWTYWIELAQINMMEKTCSKEHGSGNCTFIIGGESPVPVFQVKGIQ